MKLISFSTCQKLRQLLEKDTKLEIENKSSPYIPEITENVNVNPETPMVQIDNKKEASSKVKSLFKATLAGKFCNILGFIRSMLQ